MGCRTNGLSDQRAVGPMGSRNNGLLDQQAVGPMGYRTNGLSDQKEVTDNLAGTKQLQGTVII